MNQELYSKALEVWQAGPQANSDDYHSSTGFLSNSFISDFLHCEYNAMIKFAKVDDIDDGFNEHFAIGHLTEAIIFEGDEGRQKMLEKYGDNAINTRGKPYSWVEKAEEYAESVLAHKNLVNLLNAEGGEYHKTLFFKLHGVDFRAEVDFMNLNKLIEIDLKTTKSNYVDKSYNKDTRQYNSTFIDDFNYHRQRAIYQAGIKSTHDVLVTPHILSVSKSTKSVRMFVFDDQERLNYEIANLAPVVDRFKEVVSGEVEPRQCETCERCVNSEVIDFVIKTSEYCAPWNW